MRGEHGCGFFREDLSEFCIFGRKGFLGLGCFCLHGEINGHSQLVNGCHGLGVGEL